MRFTCLVVVLIATEALSLGIGQKKPKLKYDIESAESLFLEFINTHNKVYENEAETKLRFELFKNNLVKFNKLNEENELTTFGITRFADMTKDELLRHAATYAPVLRDSSCNSTKITTKNAPESHDWTTLSKVTEVKNQLNCGSCYAFSAIANIESQYAIKYNKLITLSEQQIVDCDKDDNGCNGGFMETVFEYVMKEGIEMESDYPYKAVRNDCRLDKSKTKTNIGGCLHLEIGNEEELKQALFHYGPLSIAIYAPGDSFYHYLGGIFEKCPDDKPQLNHGVLLVGYGTDNGVPFWKMKNSYGPDWGEDGYIRFIGGKDECEITSYVSTAIIA